MSYAEKHFKKKERRALRNAFIWFILSLIMLIGTLDYYFNNKAIIQRALAEITTSDKSIFSLSDGKIGSIFTTETETCTVDVEKSDGTPTFPTKTNTRWTLKNCGADVLRANAIKYMEAQLGKPYEHGASRSLAYDATHDCSSIIMKAYAHDKKNRIFLGWWTDGIEKSPYLTPIKWSERRPGDIVFFHPVGKNNHMAMVYDETHTIEAKSKKDGVIIYKNRAPHRIKSVYRVHPLGNESAILGLMTSKDKIPEAKEWTDKTSKMTNLELIKSVPTDDWYSRIIDYESGWNYNLYESKYTKYFTICQIHKKYMKNEYSKANIDYKFFKRSKTSKQAQDKVCKSALNRRSWDKRYGGITFGKYASWQQGYSASLKIMDFIVKGNMPSKNAVANMFNNISPMAKSRLGWIDKNKKGKWYFRPYDSKLTDRKYVATITRLWIERTAFWLTNGVSIDR